MKQVQNRVFLLCILLVSVRSVDCKAPVNAKDLAVIPFVADSSPLVRLEIVLGKLAGNHQHIEITGTVPLDHIVLRVVHGNAVNHKVVCVDIRSGKVNCH